MKSLIAIVLAFAIVLPGVSQEGPGDDLLSRYLFPPELILQYQTELSLTDKQRDTIMSAVHQLQKAGSEARSELEAEREKLVAMLKREHADEDMVLTQIEKIQAQQAKQTLDHLRQVLRMKNALSAEQQAKLAELKKKGPAQYPPPSLQKKLEHLQSRMEEEAAAGRDPSDVGELMQDFEGLIKNGKLAEAEALVNRALKMLEEKR